MVKLKPDEQAAFLQAEPGVFQPASGAWGRSGSTIIKLRAAKISIVRQALIAALRNIAPQRLVEV